MKENINQNKNNNAKDIFISPIQEDDNEKNDEDECPYHFEKKIEANEIDYLEKLNMKNQNSHISNKDNKDN